MDTDHDNRKRRRRMVEFTIDEISAVDRPAQAGATMSILKRQDDDREPDMQFRKIEPEPLAFETFEQVVGYLKRNGASNAAAMEKAAIAFPRLLDAYQLGGIEAAERATADAIAKRGPSRGAQAWQLIVAGIAERDGVSRATAMERARRLHPREFAEYQSG